MQMHIGFVTMWRAAIWLHQFWGRDGIRDYHNWKSSEWEKRTSELIPEITFNTKMIIRISHFIRPVVDKFARALRTRQRH